MYVKISSMGKKMWAVLLIGALVFAYFNGSSVFAGGESSGKIKVTPFGGQEYYYGQSKTFLKDEHYSLSPDTVSGAAVDCRLGLESEEVGDQKFKLTGDTDAFVLAEDAPTCKVKNLDINEKAEDIPAVNKAYMENEEIDSVRLTAPQDYLISTSRQLDAAWGEELEIDKKTLQEGENPLEYYLRSNKDDKTRKAIDTNPKKIIIHVDTVVPVISTLSAEADDKTAEGSIASSELGTYYYIVVSENYFNDSDGDSEHGQETEPVPAVEEIRKKVESNEGIVGYGRIDKETPVDLSIQNLKPETSYVMYAFLVDKAGNESKVEKVSFITEKTPLEGEVTVTGDVAVDSTLTAVTDLKTVDPGDVTYQWYRVKVTSDAERLEEAFDETGGAEKDDLEADDEDEEDEDEEDEEDGEDEDEEEDEDEIEIESIRKLADDATDNNDVESEERIEGAVSRTYKITKEDIGYRLSVVVSTTNASRSVTGSTDTFVPKLMPVYKAPVIAKAAYSPLRKLSAIKLPGQWSWVDDTIVPVYGNSGYRARFVPSDTKVYKTVIIRVKVPLTKRTLKKSMVRVPKKAAYAGRAIRGNYTVKDQKKVLTDKKDFTALYRNNKKLGTARVRLQGRGNYKGTVNFSYKIVKRSVRHVTCLYDKEKTYNGKNRTPDLQLRNDSVKMKLNTDYTVEYRNNREIGRASVIIRGKGNYRGKRTIRFSIVPKKPIIRRVTKKKGQFRLTVKKDSTVKGYYVYVSTSGSFAKAKTQRYSTTGDVFGIQGLEKGTYYVRVKAYSTKDGNVYTSAYSRKKKIKVK